MSCLLLLVYVNQRGDARSAVHVFNQVEERRILAVIHDLRVDRPVLKRGDRDASGDASLAERVRRDGATQPIAALGQGLERRGGGVHAIVADVTRAREAEGLPLRGDLAAEGGRRRVDWVGRPKARSAKIGPGSLRLIPLNDELSIATTPTAHTNSTLSNSADVRVAAPRS